MEISAKNVIFLEIRLNIIEKVSIILMRDRAFFRMKFRKSIL